MKTAIAFAAAHPVLAVIIVWGAGAAIRGAVSSATGYNPLRDLLESLAARKRAGAEA